MGARPTNFYKFLLTKKPAQARRQLARDGRHDRLRGGPVFRLGVEAARHLQPVRGTKMQAEFPVFFSHPHRQDGEPLLSQQQDKPSRPRGGPVEHAAGLVAAFRRQAQDSLRMIMGVRKKLPY